MLINESENFDIKSLHNFLNRVFIPNDCVSFLTPSLSFGHLTKMLPLFKKAKSIRILINNPIFQNNIHHYELTKLESQFTENPFDKKLKLEFKDHLYAQELLAIFEKIAIKAFDYKHFEGLYDDFFLINNEAFLLYDKHFLVKDFKLDASNLSSRIKQEFVIDEQFQNYELTFNNLWTSHEFIDVKTLVKLKLTSIAQAVNADGFFDKTICYIFSKKLQEIKSKFTDNNDFQNSQIWNCLKNYQQVGVRAAIEKIEDYGGCLIADSVGLGKTYSALAVIRYYETQNKNVIVIVPKKLVENWKIFKNRNNRKNPLKDDFFNYILIKHTDIAKTTGKVEELSLKDYDFTNFDLIVVDESHAFRNNSKRFSKLLEWVTTGKRTKVLLLTATPVNNSPKDLINQFMLLTQNNDKALVKEDINSIKQVIYEACKTFNQIIKNDIHEDFSGQFSKLFFKVLTELTISRSRRQIKNFYGCGEGLHFPKRLKTENYHIGISHNNEHNDRKYYEELLNLNFNAYNYRAFLKTAKSDGNKQKSTQTIITTMILKRLESSLHAVLISLKNIYNYNITLLNLLNDPQVETINFKSLLAQISLTDEENEELENLETTEKITKMISKQELLVDSFQKTIVDENKQLLKITKLLSQIQDKKDYKLTKLQEIIETKITKPFNENNRKILIFTSYADTAKYLFEKLCTFSKQRRLNLRIGLITGSKNDSNLPEITTFEDILFAFSPQSIGGQDLKQMPTEQIDLLIGTDAISEGQNLQDCDCEINYDIHWNPVKIIQRFGRIDRIGSLNKTVKMISFWPDITLDSYINLERKVKSKSQLVNTTASGDEDILNEIELENFEKTFRDKQLKLLSQANESVFDDNVNQLSIAQITIDDLLYKTKERFDKQKNALNQSYTGFYTEIKVHDNNKIWLKQIGKSGYLFVVKNKRVITDPDNDFEGFKFLFAPDKKTFFEQFQTDDVELFQIFQNLIIHNLEADKKVQSMTFNPEKIAAMYQKAITDLIEQTHQTHLQNHDFELVSFLHYQIKPINHKVHK